MTLDVQKLKELTKLQFIKDEVKDVWTPVLEASEEAREDEKEEKNA